MRYYIIAFLLLWISGTTSYAQETYSDSLFKLANERYSAQDYIAAIENYEVVADTGFGSPELFFNLGNAYFKNKDYANAILNYERSLLLDPRNDDAKFNLQKAQAYTIDRIEVIPEFFLVSWLRGFISVFPSNVWAITAFIAFLSSLFLLWLFFNFKARNQKVTAFAIAILLLTISLFSYSFAIKTKDYIENSDQAIVMESTVTVKGSPDATGINVFIIHEGTKVRILRALGDWYEIKIADGKQGWLPQLAVEII